MELTPEKAPEEVIPLIVFWKTLDTFIPLLKLIAPTPVLDVVIFLIVFPKTVRLRAFAPNIPEPARLFVPELAGPIRFPEIIQLSHPPALTEAEPIKAIPLKKL